MKQTAVEWLEDNIDREMPYREILMVIKQAKEMEKKQIIEFAEAFATSDAIYCSGEFAVEKDAEQYYNETFKSE
jgi:hypothetical protein